MIAVLERLLPAVADHLGDGWRVATGYQNDGTDALLYGPDGEQLRAVYGGHRLAERDRIRFAGALPEHLWRHKPIPTRSPACTVATSRDPAAIAREITRRVLPDYRQLLAHCTARATVLADAEHRRDLLVAAILDRLPGTWDPHGQRLSLAGRYGDQLAGELRLQATGDVMEVNLKVPHHRAAALIDALDALAAVPSHRLTSPHPYLGKE